MKTYLAKYLLPLMALVGCSDDSSSNSVNVEGTSDENISSSSSEDEAQPVYKVSYLSQVMHFTSAPSEKMDYGHASVIPYEVENGAYSECTGDSKKLEGAVKILGDTLATVFSGTKLSGDLSKITAFAKTSCLATNLDLLTDTLFVNDGEFEYACLYKTSESGMNGQTMKVLGDVMSYGCNIITAGASTSTGRLETEDVPPPIIASSSSATDVASSSSTAVQPAFSNGDATREQYNTQMQKQSSDSTFLMPKEVLGLVQGRKGDLDPITKISLEDAEKRFPNTIKTLKEEGVSLKDDYYLIYAPIDSWGYINAVTKVSSECITVMYTFQTQEDNTEYGCHDTEEIFGAGIFFLVDSEEDLTKATFDYKNDFSHNWHCGCEATDESCKFLINFFDA